jgi:hypothetical protein
MDICRLLSELTPYTGPYGPEAEAIGQRIMTAADQVKQLLEFLYAEKDIFSTAFAVQLAYWHWDMLYNAFDLLHGGDVFTGVIDPYPFRYGIEIQLPFARALRKLYDPKRDTLKEEGHFSGEECDFIRESFYSIMVEENAPVPQPARENATVQKTEDEEILQSVAKFMQEGNKLFDVLQQLGIAGNG